MFKFLINPAKFIYFAKKINRPLLVISASTLILGLIIVFFISPNDYQQGSTVKIMYVHVPAAWISLMVFFVMTVAAAEVAVGLALIVAIFRSKASIDVDAVNLLKG
mgnify:CR=1 FL=1